MKKLLPGMVTIAAALFASTTGAQAQGWYIRGDVGYTGIEGNLDARGPAVTPPGRRLNAEADYDANLSEHLGFGYDFDGFRLEAEGAHRFNRIDTDANFTDGDIHAWSGHLNGLFDINPKGAVTPYIGAGLGYTALNASASNALGTAPFQSFNTGDGSFSYQGLAGVAFKLSRAFAIDIGYRYLGVTDPEFSGRSGQTRSSNGTPATFASDYSNHTVTAGFRWTFAKAPPAPPPPPPAPPPPPPVVERAAPVVEAPPVQQVCPAQEFIVYFAWDRSELNADGQRVLDEAVAQARQCNVNGVVISGFTDTSGSPTYNLALSQRRANIVRDGLVSRGIGTDFISTEAAGESRLSKPTGDGVREPLNRRSVIGITFR